jgi:UDP-2,4-diacetamido-2,4,6-trideoxy-beta-L-altropyranose hydrolase
MKFAIRTDASLSIGNGHVMRCLSLAERLRTMGSECVFVCREHRGHLLDLIRRRGFAAISLRYPQPVTLIETLGGYETWLGIDWESDAQQTIEALQGVGFDWLVVDHYGIDYRWEIAVRQHGRRVLIIDDLANRIHDCDLLLDQNLGRSEADYKALLKSGTKLLIGPSFSILRPQFAEFRPSSLERRREPKLKNLLVAMGGTDMHNVTGQILETVTSDMRENLNVTVVMGENAPWLDEVNAQAMKSPETLRVLTGVSNMAELMSEADLAIGAAGGTAWERCALGLPSIIVPLAANQLVGAQALHQVGAALVLKDTKKLTKLIRKIVNNDRCTKALTTMSEAASKVTDGLGSSRVAMELK